MNATSTHPVTADTLVVSRDADGQATLTITVPDSAPITLSGDYRTVRDWLLLTTANVIPTPDDREEIIADTFQALLAEVRTHLVAEVFNGIGQTADELLGRIASFSVWSEDFDNGWCLNGVTASAADGTQVEIDELMDDDGICLDELVSERFEDVVLIAGERPSRNWECKVTRPAVDTPAVDTSVVI